MSVDSRLKRADGLSLVTGVPMDSWCVTFEDLLALRKSVKEAVLSGKIHPTERDQFLADDDLIGPCVHTVVEQLIKPVTYMAGGQSWALLAHPSGLKCDLFISHSWAEGMYEFIDKVLNSWPRGLKHAYCCMLCNPQNLDIGSMIASPSDSPFAKALTAARHILVVPNRTVSVYSRIWCVYEVFLGYIWKKTISTASAPIQHFRLQLFIAFVVFLISFSACFLYARESFLTYDFRHGLYIAAQLHLVASSAVLSPSGRRLLNYVGLTICGAIIECTRNQNIRSTGYGLTLVAAFVGSEADRMLNARLVREVDCLMKGYTGHHRDAKSSVEGDRLKILNEMEEGGYEEAVNHTIAVLLRSGMITDNLRKAYERGVEVEAAGTFRYAFVIYVIGIWAYYNFRFPNDFVAAITTSITLCLFLALLCASAKDSRAFAAMVAYKILIVPDVLDTILGILVYDLDVCRQSMDSCRQPMAYLSLSLILFVLSISLLGLGCVVRVPLIGPWFADVILARSHFKAMRRCCPSWCLVRRRTQCEALAEEGDIELQSHCKSPPAMSFENR